MNHFELIQESFQQLQCMYCSLPLSGEGIEILGEEDDFCVVRVRCTACQEPIGIAIVSVEMELEEPISEFTESDQNRLAQLSPITTDDVIDAHHFIRQLDSTWARHLPKHFHIDESDNGLDR